MSFKYFMFLAVTSIVLNGSNVNAGPVDLTTNKADSDESKELAMEHGTSTKRTTEAESATKHTKDDIGPCLLKQSSLSYDVYKCNLITCFRRRLN